MNLFKNFYLSATNPAGQPPAPPAEDTDDASGGQSTTTPENSGKKERVFTQAEVDKAIEDRLARERRHAEKEAEKAKREAELVSLAEQQKFQELAQKRQERVLELEGQLADFETLTTKIAKYEKALGSYRDALLANVEEKVKPLLQNLDVADQLQWLAANATTSANPNQPPPPTFPATPQPNGRGLTAEEKKAQAYNAKF